MRQAALRQHLRTPRRVVSRRPLSTAALKRWSEPMAPSYNPAQVEHELYDWWQSNKFHAPHSNTSAPVFSMVLPPPNVTGTLHESRCALNNAGTLHIGHALTVTLEDALVRHARMSEKTALWIPGLDHAGIATQAVVEKFLRKQGVTDRRRLGRERFVQEVWQWKDKYGGIINEQLRRTGASLDWSREAFTMDAPRSAAVTEAFVRLHEDGLLYRAERLVNWSPHLQTALSDIEVEYIDVAPNSTIKIPSSQKSVEVGVLHRVAYQLEDGGSIDVATTRPETILGDVAIAVHPDDPRFAPLHGKHAVHPFLDRRIPIICDRDLVQEELGTGAVKITPAHDYADFECGKRHKLSLINVLTDDGRMSDAAGPQFAGLYRFEARAVVISALEKKGLYRGKSGHATRIALCSRSGDIIEPLLKPQWYVACKSLAARARALVANDDIKLVPSDYEAEWNKWLDGIRDWCISRQLWWGHRVPAYRITAPQSSKGEQWVAGRTEAEAKSKATALLSVPESQVTLVQDEDVLDTWFSSALFPLSTLGWPANTADLERFYPLSVMETGADILFFWVVRMVMICTHLSGTAPFRTVLLHPLVRDSEGRKMSKSLGNVIDPLQVAEGTPLAQLKEALQSGNVDPAEIKRATKVLEAEFPQGIPQCGMDALRFALADYTHQGRAINMSVSRVVAVRHFCNKIWNASRFVMSQLEAGKLPPPLPGVSSLRLVDQWLLSRLRRVVCDIQAAFESLQLHRATSAFHSFFLYDFCDVYIEWSKLSLKSPDTTRSAAAVSILLECLETSLRLLHPFMPFLTEEIWQRLPHSSTQRSASISLASFPTKDRFAELPTQQLESQMQLLQSVIHASRSLRDSFGVEGPAPFVVFAPDNNSAELLRTHTEELRHFMRCSSLDIQITPDVNVAAVQPGRAVRSAEVCVVSVQLAGLVNTKAEIQKVAKRLKAAEKRLEELDTRVSRPGYDANVPAPVKEKDAAERQKQRAIIAELRSNERVLAQAGDAQK